jgi:hypothetical protein
LATARIPPENQKYNLIINQIKNQQAIFSFFILTPSYWHEHCNNYTKYSEE